MPLPLREVPHPATAGPPDEWLLTNGLGGYAMGTVAGPLTRRYHGLLVAALPGPLGRVVMLQAVVEHLQLPSGRGCHLGLPAGTAAAAAPPPAPSRFRCEAGLPVWSYELDGYLLEKTVVLLHRQNTVHITYRLLRGPGLVQLTVRPAVHFRLHAGLVSAPLHDPYVLTAAHDGYELQGTPMLPALRLACSPATAITGDGLVLGPIFYAAEAELGYDHQGSMYSPGSFQLELSEGQRLTLIASTESWETLRKHSPQEVRAAELARRQALLEKALPQVRRGVAAELVLAADQFLITHADRPAAGTVIAGYPWFTDWGRDTMISLEGLTLSTGRLEEAGRILRSYAQYLRDGLLPNLFPEGGRDGLYHTADATLWFFHALDRYVRRTDDRGTLRGLLPALLAIVDAHVRGTHFGIQVDASDGLLRQGQDGYQLTWMDAKVDGWVVTPRRGKAVEINALWYNALRLLEGWLRDEQDEAAAQPLREQADRAWHSFNRRFWYARGGYLYDVVDGEQGDDPACRPNQVLAISLAHPIIDPGRWEAILGVVENKLLTPVGLRSLAPDEPAYKPRYGGDLQARDAAYHQGTVWAWLIGPFIDAWRKVHPEKRHESRQFLAGLTRHLDAACVGSISEIFDGEPPHTPRGCIAQGWSVAEVLRCWALDPEPG